jgi:hypothetical protein
VWLIIGLVFYFTYGRRKSTVALQGTEGLAPAQPRVNEAALAQMQSF